MESLKSQTLEALEVVPPEVLRALAAVPAEVLLALKNVPAEALARLHAAAEGEVVAQPAGAAADDRSRIDDLVWAIDAVDKAMKAADVNVVHCFGKWRDPKDPQQSRTWWNGWIDSGGGGVTKLLGLPDYEVARVFAVLGSEVRLAILRSLLDAPKSAAELVAELRLGTSGQAYHHLQELIRAGFVEGQDGRYRLKGGRLRAYFTALAVAADLVPKSEGDAAS